LLSCEPDTLLEIGFGNARFLRQVAPHVKHAIGLDWALSPLARDLPANVTIVQADVVSAEVPAADLVCSSDVLEHFRPEDLDTVIGKLHRATLQLSRHRLLPNQQPLVRVRARSLA
jgi:hypothetical protein